MFIVYAERNNKFGFLLKKMNLHLRNKKFTKLTL